MIYKRVSYILGEVIRLILNKIIVMPDATIQGTINNITVI